MTSYYYKQKVQAVVQISDLSKVMKCVDFNCTLIKALSLFVNHFAHLIIIFAVSKMSLTYKT